MKALEPLFLWWQRRKTRRKMDRVFSRGEDPYGYRRSPYEAARLAAMEEVLGKLGNAEVLEIGCAEGAFTERLKPRARRLVAVDISEVALSRAKKKLPSGVEFVLADIRDWSPSGFFDLVVLGDVLYYLDKPLVGASFEETFRRVAGWVHPGGMLLLAHGFAGDAELAHRRGFRERFEKQGFHLQDERVVGEGLGAGPVRCLLSVLRGD